MGEKREESAGERRAPSPLFVALQDQAVRTAARLLEDEAAARWFREDKEAGRSALLVMAAPGTMKGMGWSGVDLLPKLFAALEGDLVREFSAKEWKEAEVVLPEGKEWATPLEIGAANWFAAGALKAAEEARRLVQAGAKASPRALGAALIAAASQGHEGAVRTLLELGADPDARDERGMGPLHRVDHAETAALLLAAGADPLAPSAQGKLPAELAAERGREEVARKIFEAGAKARAKASKAAAKAKAPAGDSAPAAVDSAAPLFAALAKKSAALFRGMLSKGSFDIRGAKSEGGERLLEAALAQGMWVDAKRLLLKGASLNDLGKDGAPLWGHLARRDLGWRPRKKEQETVEELWAWAAESGGIDFAARRASGHAEVDALAGKGGSGWSRGMGWREMERRALEAGLERTPSDWALLTTRGLEMAAGSTPESAEIFGLGRRGEEGEREKIREAIREWARNSAGCDPREARAQLREAAKLASQLQWRKEMAEMTLGIVEDLLEIHPEAPLEIREETQEDLRRRLEALAQRRDLGRSVAQGADGAAKARKKGL